jgi:hypothetical protein
MKGETRKRRGRVEVEEEEEGEADVIFSFYGCVVRLLCTLVEEGAEEEKDGEEGRVFEVASDLFFAPLVAPPEAIVALTTLSSSFCLFTSSSSSSIFSTKSS